MLTFARLIYGIAPYRSADPGDSSSGGGSDSDAVSDAQADGADDDSHDDGLDYDPCTTPV